MMERAINPKYNLSEESLAKATKLSKDIKELLTKENLSYKEAVPTLDLAQEEIKECKITC